MKQKTDQQPDLWAEINSRLNVAGALILIAIALLIIAYKLST